ncbi:MAG: LytTR family transcriptional regulator DNA-binding domain-containing protein [Prevotellaceae bacterium]|jgi:DNA-binding LytR/AlgR family response regulator|nr:LytTR family transcriptional regulator DNA-binding domain-containing protein [Prevotellaceae bacterium]
MKYKHLIVFDRTELRIKAGIVWNFIPYDKIVELSVDDLNLSVIKLSDDKKYYIDIPIKIFEANLPLIFFRYKRSGIINLAYISSYLNEHRKLRINLKDGTFHYVSRYLKDAFHDKIQNLSRIALPCDACRFCTKKESCADISPFVRHDPTVNS